MKKKSDWAELKARKILGEWHLLTYEQFATHLRAADKRGFARAVKLLRTGLGDDGYAAEWLEEQK